MTSRDAPLGVFAHPPNQEHLDLNSSALHFTSPVTRTAADAAERTELQDEMDRLEPAEFPFIAALERTTSRFAQVPPKIRTP